MTRTEAVYLWVGLPPPRLCLSEPAGSKVGVRKAFSPPAEILNISAQSSSPEETRMYEDGGSVIRGGGGGGGEGDSCLLIG